MAVALAVFIAVLLIGAPIALVMVFSGLAGAMALGGTEFLETSPTMFAGVAVFADDSFSFSPPS
jgi:hypothetical protein